MRSDKQTLFCRRSVRSGLLLRRLCLSYALRTNGSPETQTIHGFMRRRSTAFTEAPSCFPPHNLKKVQNVDSILRALARSPLQV